MQHNNNNSSIAKELENIAGQIASLDKVDVQGALAEIQKAHIEIENIAKDNELSTLRTIIHWVSLNTEVDEDNDVKISVLLVDDSYSNWIDVLANVLRNSELSLLPILHESLTSPDWLVRPSAPLLKEVAEWVSEIKIENDSESDQETIMKDEPTNQMKSDSIDDLIDEEIDKAIHANEELLIQTNAFQDVDRNKLEKDFIADINLNESLIIEPGVNIPLINDEEYNFDDDYLDNSESVEDNLDIELIENDLIKNDIIENQDHQNKVIDDKLFTENDQLLEAITTQRDTPSSNSNIIDQTDLSIELNDIILKLKSINVNANDVFASKESYLKQIERLILLTSTSSYEPITPIAEWCKHNLQLFEKNLTAEISDFIHTGAVWSWIEQLNDCISNNNKESCIKNLATELTQEDWLEPLDTGELQTLLHWVKSIISNDDDVVVATKSDGDFSNLEKPELIDIVDIVDEDIDNEDIKDEEKGTSPSEVSGFQVNWNDDTHPELLMVYLEETPSQITELVDLLGKVSNKTADKEDKKLASRLAHTIKGGSAIVGITALSEFSNHLETLLDYSTKHKLPNELLELLPHAANCLDSLFEAVQLQLNEPTEFYPLFKKLDKHVNTLDMNEDEIELDTPELPDFIQNQNSDADTEESFTDPMSSIDEIKAEESPLTDESEKSPFELNWDDDVHPELLMVYLEETPEQINGLVPLMLKISEGTADEDDKKVASRMAHTIKGASALVGITALSEFSYRLETLLDHSVKHSLSDEILTVLPDAASCLEALFSAVQLQEEEPAEYYSLFLQLDTFVNNLDEVDESLELTTPELPDFIQNQNNQENSELPIETELNDDNEKNVDAPGQSDATQGDELVTEEVVSLEKLKSPDDLQDITNEIDDIVMNLVNIGSNAKNIAANLNEYTIELQRFDLIADISGYPELALLNQWCQTNLELLAKNNSDQDHTFISSASIWNWIEFVSASLSDPDDMSHLSSLSAELMRDEWPQAIEMQDLQTVLLALRHLENDNIENETNSVKNSDVTDVDNAEIISWDQDVHPELLVVYFEETPDQINTVAQLLHKIAKRESDAEDHKKAARIAHTIKGASGVVGLNSLVDLTHNLEDILDYAISNDIPEETAELLAEASDCLESLFENIRHKLAEPEEYQSVLERLISFSSSIDRERVNPEYLLNNESLTTDSSDIETITFADTTSKPDSPIKIANSNVSINEAHIRVPVSVIDKLLNLAGELVTTSSQVGDKLTKALVINKTIKSQDQRVHKMLDELSLTISHQEKEQKQMFASLENSDFDSLEMDSYNELHSVASLLSESILDGQELDNSLTKQLNELNEKLRSLNKLNKGFSDVILRSRMVSIDTIVPRLERIVRQTCRKTGKKAELVVTGKNINIDTDILNGLLDPLLHMLRNSIDHGIESPAQRLKKKKDETGLIELSFVRDGNNIRMSLQDDGAGIDPEVIYQKAVHKSLITPNHEFSKSDILKLILIPGFSTQENVSDISGRGVGMDVVNTSVEELNGSLKIESELGHGTSFNLTIPLTLITNTTLMVKAADNIVAVPTDTIEQILYQQANSVIARDNSFFVEYEGEELEIKSLSQLLGWAHHIIDFSHSFSLLLIKSGKESHAIHIDSIISSREVVVKPLSPWILPARGVVGACHLNDGGVAPVINLVTVVKQTIQANRTSSKSVIEPKEVITTPQILVVDDSLSNRKALSLIIDKTEYDVLTAVDGMDALQIMNENKIDLVFTDLEMPRMNGLELTQAIRSWTDKSKIPIVMITSRTTNKHRELAKKAGVNDYLTKPVVTETLLESIDTWLVQTESVEA